MRKKRSKVKKIPVKKRPEIQVLTLMMIAVITILLLGYYFFVYSSENQISTKSEYDIGIVDQFYSQSPEFSDSIADLASKLGLKVHIHKDEEITVEFYRKLPTFGYKLIILRVHAGVYEGRKSNPTFLFTSENYTTSKYVVEQLSEMIRKGIIDPNNPEPVFAVSPDFIRTSEGDFNGATIILSSCRGLFNKYLAEAFMDKGARVFISWDDMVSLKHTDDAVLLLFKCLLMDKMTIEEAVETVMNEVGSDPDYGSTLRFYPFKEGETKLEIP